MLCEVGLLTCLVNLTTLLTLNNSDCVISNDRDTSKEVQGAGSGLILSNFLNDS